MPDALDQSWDRVDPGKAAAAGARLVAGYLSHDPSKNWTPDWVRAYHNAGIGVLLNWESTPGRPLEGPDAGREDAAAATAQAQALFDAVGHSAAPVGIVFSCDRDTNPTQYPAIDGYYGATRTITHTAGLLNGTYGEFDVIEHLHAAGLTDVEWQTIAWSNGRVSPQADLYQYAINSTVANSSVDLNQIIHTDTLGAWWPAGSAEEAAVVAGAHPITKTPIQPAPVEDGMYELLTIANTRAVVVAGPGLWYHLEGTTPAERTKNVADAKSGPFWNGKVTNVSQAGAQFWKNLYLSGQKG